VAGQEIVTPPAHEEAQVINLMEALKQSVARVQQQAPEEVEAAEAGQPPKKMAKSMPKKPPAQKKRKSS